VWFGVVVLMVRSSFSLLANKSDGSIPWELGPLCRLAFIDMSDNAVSDSVPEEISFPAALQEVVFSPNDFSGMSRDFAHMELSSIRFRGEIPTDVFEFT